MLSSRYPRRRSPSSTREVREHSAPLGTPSARLSGQLAGDRVAGTAWPRIRPVGPFAPFPAGLRRRGPARRARTRPALAPPTSPLKVRWFPIIRPQASVDTSPALSRWWSTPPFAANLDTRERRSPRGCRRARPRRTASSLLRGRLTRATRDGSSPSWRCSVLT
jgi:hypothetical protein